MKIMVRTLLFPFRGLARFIGFGSHTTQARQKPRPRPVRRIAAAVGFVGVLVGISLISLGAYDYLGSSEMRIPEKPRVLDYRFDPGGIYDRPVGVVTPTPQPSPTPTAEPTEVPVVAPAPPPPPLRDQPFSLVINKIDVNASVFTYGLDANQVPEVPLNPWDVAWYDFSAQPGTGSNAVLAGHYTWQGVAVFYDLDQLVPGDEIKLIGQNGVELVYAVTESFLLDPNDPTTLSVMYPTDDDIVTLITCGGTFFPTGDPIAGGDYTDRRIVIATLQTISEV